MHWPHKDLLDVSQLSVEEIRHIFDTARHFLEINRRPIKKVPTLKGKSVVLFLPSHLQGPGLPLIWPLNAFQQIVSP